MVGKRVSFPFWTKSLFCRGEVGAVCFGETYDVTDLDVSTRYFWDPYHFFFAKTDFRTELVRGLQRKMRKFVSLLVDIYFFEIWGKLVGIWLGYFGNLKVWMQHFHPLSFLKANKISCLLLRDGGDVWKVFVLVSQVHFFVQISNVAMSLNTLGFLDLQWFPTRILQGWHRSGESVLLINQWNGGSSTEVAPATENGLSSRAAGEGDRTALLVGGMKAESKLIFEWYLTLTFVGKKSFFVCLFVCSFFKSFFFRVKHELHNFPCFLGTIWWIHELNC